MYGKGDTQKKKVLYGLIMYEYVLRTVVRIPSHIFHFPSSSVVFIQTVRLRVEKRILAKDYLSYMANDSGTNRPKFSIIIDKRINPLLADQVI